MRRSVEYAPIIVFMIVLFVALVPGNVYLMSGVLIIGIMLVVIVSKMNPVLVTFLVYPFSFLLRNHHPGEALIVLAPEILWFFSLLLVIKNVVSQDIRSVMIPVGLLTFYAVFVFLSSVYHWGGLNGFQGNYLLEVVRLYVLPVVYIAALIIVSVYDQSVSEKGLLYSSFSFGVLGLLAIVNYYYPFLNRDIASLQSILNYNEDGLIVAGRYFMGVYMPRLNLLIGGMVGSVAAIYIGLSYFLFRESEGDYIKIIFSVILFVAAMLTLSYTPIAVILFILILSLFIGGENRMKNVLMMVFLFYATMSFGGAGDLSLYEYGSDMTSAKFHFVSEMSFKDLFSGYGFWLLSSDFGEAGKYYGPIDLGFFRILLDVGIVPFVVYCFFVLIILRILLNGFFYKKKSNDILPYAVLLFSFLIGIHGNVAMTTPVFPVFAALVAKIINLNVHQNYDSTS